MNKKISLKMLIGLLLLTATSLQASDSDKPSEAETIIEPAAQAVVDAYIEATGGRKAWEKIKYMTFKGSFAVPQQERTGKIMLLSKDQSKVYTVADASPFGKQIQAYNGEIGWFDNSTTGSGLFQGEDLLLIQKQTKISPELELDTLYAKVVRLEDSEEGAIVLQLIDRRGFDEIWEFDPTTKLMKSMEYTISGGERGSYRAKHYLSEFQRHGEVLFPTRVETVNPAFSWITKIDTIDVTTPIPDELFDPPSKILDSAKAKPSQ
jgi:hypothetical protein